MIVDDEPMVTRSLESLLRLETEYAISSFQTPADALNRLKERPADIIVSDFMMPEMNGLEFLRQARELHPDVPRIMLTGYADKENAIQAINEIGLFQYIEKPWDNDHFRMVIRNGIEQHSLRRILKQRIHELDMANRRADHLHKQASLMQDELEQARLLLHELMLEQLPRRGPATFSVRYRPAMPIGGDFYDLIDLADNHAAVLLADLTGHGIKAALSIALLKFAFSRFAGQPAGPEKILCGINTAMHEGLPSGVFAAAAVVVIDIKNARYHIANAGLPHPLLIRRSENRFERICAEGLLLGVTETDLFPEVDITTVAMRESDALLLMTDGVTEMEMTDDRQFGDCALHEFLHEHLNEDSAALLRNIEEHCLAQRKQDSIVDDVTMLTIDHSLHRSTP